MSKDVLILVLSLALIGAGGLIMRWFVQRFVNMIDGVHEKRAANSAPTRSLKPFPFPVVTVAGHEALTTFEKLKAEGLGTPLLVGDPHTVDALNYWVNQPKAPSAEKTLKRAGLLKQPFSIEDFLTGEYGAIGDEEENEALIESGRWPSKVEPMTVTVLHCDLRTRVPLPLVSIIRLPCQDPAEIFAHLNWGNWNANPAPHVHIALMRKWQNEWGAEVIGITADSLNVQVKRRPETRKAAIDLAREQVWYCSDVIEQAPGQLKNLAAILMKSDVWHFWWD